MINYSIIRHVDWNIVMPCSKMEVFITEGRLDKVNRWLGFIQGCLWTQKINTLDRLKDMNRKK
jgi:hypothetical protein